MRFSDSVIIRYLLLNHTSRVRSNSDNFRRKLIIDVYAYENVH